MRVAVIGAGIVGASVAFRLSQGDAQVWLVDKAAPASGTTSASFAWLNANNKTPREYFELNRAGMEEHSRLRDELPDGAPWFHQDGNLIWVADGDLEELERRVERLSSWGYAARWRSASWVGERLEPKVAFPNPDTPVAYFPEEGWIDAPLLTNTLISLARRNGARVISGSEVRSVEMKGGRVSGIRLSNEDTIPVDVVVNAAGPAADRIGALVGRELPLKSKDGLLARVATEPGLLGRLLHTPDVNLRPDGPGYILLHHGSVDEKLTGAEEKHPAGELLGRARRIIPALANAELEEVRVGTRPVPSDGFSCAGGIKSLSGYYEAVTHSGVTLGPLIGCFLAREILTGEADPMLAPYRPDRFEF